MRVEEEDTRVLVKGILRAVAVVDIPVDDQHAFEAVHRLRVAGGERHGVEQAESHPLRRCGMVAGGTDDREGVGHATGADCIDRAEEPPGGMAGGVERGLSVDRRVAGGEDDEPSGDILRHDPQVIRRVDAAKLGVGDRARHKPDAALKQAVTLQPVEDGLHPRRRFRVPRPSVMEERGGIGDKSGHRHGPRRERGSDAWRS